MAFFDIHKKIEVKKVGLALGTWILVVIFMMIAGIILDKLGIPDYNSMGLNEEAEESIFILFAFVHVGNYAFAYDEPMLLLNLIKYIPLGIGTSVIYEKNKNILYPMLVHIWLNILAS